jgi:hypothetical protein
MLTHSLPYLSLHICICCVQTALSIRYFCFRVCFKYVLFTCHDPLHAHARAHIHTHTHTNVSMPTLAIPWTQMEYLLFISLPLNTAYWQNSENITRPVAEPAADAQTWKC